MSVENVKAFYQRLAQDEQFRSKIQGVKSKEECSQLVQQAGYDFTKEEFESYTSQLLESTVKEGELQDLNERELEAVVGGGIKLYEWPWINDFPPFLPMYGIPPMDDDILFSQQ